MSAITDAFAALPVALLFSFSQNCFHVEDVNDVSGKGMRALMFDEPSDWIVLGFARTREEASQLAEELPRPAPFPDSLMQALAAEWDKRQMRFHCGAEGRP